MHQYSHIISLVRNARGIYCLDPIMGCASGMAAEAGGCYGDCYAAKAAKRYGHDFSKSVRRDFSGWWHLNDTIRQINSAKLDFIRMGCSGDPSEDWEHTLNIIFQIGRCNKEIVIITRHWTQLTEMQLESLAGQNICFNTSVSALDKPEIRERSLCEYNRIKPFCKSVLRIVSCDFNLENPQGHAMAKIQSKLFQNTHTLDTVFRPDKNNPLVLAGVIKTKRAKFMSARQLVSQFNRKTYLGKCSGCKEMCGLNIGENHINRRGTIKQMKLESI